MPVALSLFLVLFFLLMNAFFVAAEFSLVRVRKSQVEILVDEGRKGAKYTKLVADNVNAYLSACQLGITLASLALGWLGEPAVSALISPLLSAFGLPEAAIHAIAIAVGFIIITALHIVVGELIPKSLAIFSTEKYSLLTATPLVWFYRLTYPVMWLFNTITNGVMKMLGHDAASEHEVYTDEEIKLLIDESTESGLIDPEQNAYVDNIFDLGDKDAEAIMTPRTDLICIDLEDSLEENMQLVQRYKYTRYPACRGTKDRIVGFVHVKDLYTLSEHATVDDLRIRTIQAVPEGVPIAKLLQTLQEKRTKIAVIFLIHKICILFEHLIVPTFGRLLQQMDGSRIVQMRIGSASHLVAPLAVKGYIGFKSQRIIGCGMKRIDIILDILDGKNTFKIVNKNRNSEQPLIFADL